MEILFAFFNQSDVCVFMIQSGAILVTSVYFFHLVAPALIVVFIIFVIILVLLPTIIYMLCCCQILSTLTELVVRRPEIVFVVI